MINNKKSRFNLFFKAYIFDKKANAKLSGPPETATIKFYLIFKDFSNLL